MKNDAEVLFPNHSQNSEAPGLQFGVAPGYPSAAERANFRNPEGSAEKPVSFGQPRPITMTANIYSHDVTATIVQRNHLLMKHSYRGVVALERFPKIQLRTKNSSDWDSSPLWQFSLEQ